MKKKLKELSDEDFEKYLGVVRNFPSNHTQHAVDALRGHNEVRGKRIKELEEKIQTMHEDAAGVDI